MKNCFKNHHSSARRCLSRHIRTDEFTAEMSMDWIGLGPMTVMYKILTAYVFQRNRPRLFYV